jgi:hypothetical protein
MKCGILASDGATVWLRNSLAKLKGFRIDIMSAGPTSKIKNCNDVSKDKLGSHSGSRCP